MSRPRIFPVARGRRVPDDYKPEEGEVVRYRFVVDMPVDVATGRRRQITRTFDDRRAAEASLSEIVTGVISGPISSLRAVRQARGLRLADVAGRVGMHESQISRIELGQTVLTVDVLARLARALGLFGLEKVLTPYVTELVRGRKEA